MVPITPWRAFLSFFFPFLQSLKFCCSKFALLPGHDRRDCITEGGIVPSLLIRMNTLSNMKLNYAWRPPPPIAYERGCSMLQMLMLTLLNDSGNSCTPQVEMKAVVNLSKKKKDLHTSSSYHCWRKSCSCRHRCCCCNYLWPSSRAIYIFWLVQSFTSYQ